MSNYFNLSAEQLEEQGISGEAYASCVADKLLHASSLEFRVTYFSWRAYKVPVLYFVVDGEANYTASFVGRPRRRGEKVTTLNLLSEVVHLAGICGGVDPDLLDPFRCVAYVKLLLKPSTTVAGKFKYSGKLAIQFVSDFILGCSFYTSVEAPDASGGINWLMVGRLGTELGVPKLLGALADLTTEVSEVELVESTEPVMWRKLRSSYVGAMDSLEEEDSFRFSWDILIENAPEVGDILAY